MPLITGTVYLFGQILSFALPVGLLLAFATFFYRQGRRQTAAPSTATGTVGPASTAASTASTAASTVSTAASTASTTASTASTTASTASTTASTADPATGTGTVDPEQPPAPSRPYSDL